MASLFEKVFLLYFFSHIPITIFIDSQIVFPKWIYPTFLQEMMKNYSIEFKDPMVTNPPEWYISFCYCEMLLQFPFFFFATYAFWKGNCSWIRVPSIVYGAHVSTTVIPILAHIMTYKFPVGEKNLTGPSTIRERLLLGAIYFPYLFVPALLLIYMLCLPNYGQKPDKQRKVQ